jgi:hypothetical protein
MIVPGEGYYLAFDGGTRIMRAEITMSVAIISSHLMEVRLLNILRKQII